MCDLWKRAVVTSDYGCNARIETLILLLGNATRPFRWYETAKRQKQSAILS